MKKWIAATVFSVAGILTAWARPGIPEVVVVSETEVVCKERDCGLYNYRTSENYKHPVSGPLRMRREWVRSGNLMSTNENYKNQAGGIRTVRPDVLTLKGRRSGMDNAPNYKHQVPLKRY